MTTVALVPARSGSKGLPGKNLAEIGGRSLVAHAVEVGMDASGIDEVLVSSDDEAILAEGTRAGATPLRRPSKLAKDDTPAIDVVLHVLAHRPNAERIVLLQPTSPLRTTADVLACVEALRGASSAATVTPCEHPIEWTFRLGDGGKLRSVAGWDAMVARRQEGSAMYRLNGAVYAAEAAYLVDGGTLVGPETVGVPMPRERSIDIDDEIDLIIAQALWERSRA